MRQPNIRRRRDATAEPQMSSGCTRRRGPCPEGLGRVMTAGDLPDAALIRRRIQNASLHPERPVRPMDRTLRTQVIIYADAPAHTDNVVYPEVLL